MAGAKFIVGIDSGATKAVALIGIDTEICITYSGKNLSLSDICNYICNYGTPLIVATDRTESKFARKVASAFSAVFYSPSRNLSVYEKSRLVSRENIKTENAHQKDALAAALHARGRYSQLFTKIDSVLERKNKIYMAAYVKEYILRRRAVNISHAIELLENSLLVENQ